MMGVFEYFTNLFPSMKTPSCRIGILLSLLNETSHKEQDTFRSYPVFDNAHEVNKIGKNTKQKETDDNEYCIPFYSRANFLS